MSHFQARSGMTVCPSFGWRRISVSYIGLWAPMFATVPDWCTSKCAGAVCTEYRSVPPRLAPASGRIGEGVSCASARPRSTTGPTPAAPAAVTAVLRNWRRLTPAGRDGGFVDMVGSSSMSAARWRSEWPLTYTGRRADSKRPPPGLPTKRAASVTTERRDGHQEVERSAEVVQAAHVPADEGVGLLVGQVGTGQRRPGIGPETRPERRVLLEPIEDHVQVISAHARLHS